MPAKPTIHCDTLHPTLKVPDVSAAVAFYVEKLGFELEFTWGDPPGHAGVRLGSVAVHFSKNTPAPEGFWNYFVVGNVDQLHDWYAGNGVQILKAPASQPWGMREFELRDLNGYLLRFGQHDFTCGTPVKVERTDVHVRIEKRLAALLEDLAKHKHMTVGQTLEETLLHTFEATPGHEGQGVASPHTRETMRHIAELKKKHGIDYDTHASYRFKEYP